MSVAMLWLHDFEFWGLRRQEARLFLLKFVRMINIKISFKILMRILERGKRYPH